MLQVNDLFTLPLMCVVNPYYNQITKRTLDREEVNACSSFIFFDLSIALSFFFG